MKHLMCAALLASALLAAGCLTGCSSLYDPSDVEDPAGVGTSALLGRTERKRWPPFIRMPWPKAAWKPAATSGSRMP